MTSHRKRLIEVSLPLETISKQSAREKSIRHGHISTLHIWWARRPLAAMRAAIFASLIPAPETEKERKDLEDLIKTIVDWDQVKDGNSEAILKARRLIQEAYPDGPPKLLDPFMGGGSTGLEALRLGCATHAVELNPVAHLIELCTLVYPQRYGQQKVRKVRQGAMEVEQTVNPLAEDFRKWAEWVLEQARGEIAYLYGSLAAKETIVGYVWARTLRCSNPACQADIPLVRQWWLAKRPGHRVALQPVVSNRDNGISIDFRVINYDKAGRDHFDPSSGTSSRSAGTCLVCGQVSSKEYVKREGRAGRLGHMLLAVISEQEGLGKSYRAATDADKALFAKAVLELERILAEEPDLYPDEAIPSGSSRAIFVHLYGLTKWGHLFNPRQLLAIIKLSQQVRRAYERMTLEGVEPEYARAVATYLAILVDRTADYSSSLTRWRTSVEAIAGTFGRQALPMVWDYVEINPLGDTSGWRSSIEWVAKVIEHAATASSIPATVQQGTATRLPYMDDSCHAIITDPPYYDAVPYADLSDFFYVWLKRSVGFLYPDGFRTPLTPKSTEIIQEPARHKNDEMAKVFYEREMTAAFQDVHRVLRPDGIFTIVFAHKSTSAWETLINSLLDAGLIVTASWPLNTERPGRLRAHGSAALASSIFIVCRVRIAERDGYLDNVRDELHSVIKERLDFFWQEGIRGADFFISAIGPAVSVFGRYSKVYKLDGAEVGVGALLDLVQELVADYALDRILNGHRESVGAVDAATRYYILHRWSYGSTDVPFDDAMRLAMALGADIDALMDRRGVLKQSGETVKLLGPKQRGKREELGEVDRAGRPAPVIDVLHRAVTLWESGQREALARFLADNAHGREEQVRLVAQTLIDILPQDDRERRLLEGFLAGRDSVPDAPRQERLL